MFHVPDELAPADAEAAVLSMLVVREGSSWTLVSGSLLTVPAGVAGMSWKRWGELQPEASSQDRGGGLDLGPIFCTEPFEGVRVVRAIIGGAEWRQMVDGLADGQVKASSCHCDAVITGSTSTVFLGRDGSTWAHWAIHGAQRPVLGIVATLEAPEMPATEAIWQLAVAPYLSRGRERGAMFTQRHLVHWADALLGINWPAGGDVVPPARFVIGRVQSRGWIVDLKPDYDSEQVVVSIAWDENLVDPLGCALLTRAEHDGLPVLVRHQPISDLPRGPVSAAVTTEPWELSWRERTLEVAVPRGPRRTEWGVLLLGPSGELLDERPVVRRAEQINFTLQIKGSSSPASVSTVGDQRPPPSHLERDEAVRAAVLAETEARRAAAHRRISTAGELEEYLRWRFCCRAGELLLLDPGLFSQKDGEEEVVRFLAGFNRPIRALVRGVHEKAGQALSAAPAITAKALPGGGKALHDRIWIVGETAVLVGASPGDFLSDSAGAPRRATTATDLPFADAAIWRERFEEWWGR
jgi:hypothetical protein